MVEESVTQVEPDPSLTPLPQTIMIVDDDTSQVDALEYRLQQQGYQTLTAYSGQQALSQARQQVPDLILLDLRLPDLGGFDVCAELADSPRTCGIPIFIVSAMERPDIVRRSRAVGGQYFVRKPYDPNVLLTLIENSLQGDLRFDW